MAWSRASRQSRGYGRDHERQREALLKREPLCRECGKLGRTTEAAIADHIIPRSKGGTNDRENYQPLCGPCSDAKTQAEASEAQGRTYRPRQEIGSDGWPIELPRALRSP